MPKARVTKAELQILEQLWTLKRASVREIQESLPEKKRPAYTTVQTLVSRLEEKGVVRRAKKIGNAHVFEPVLTQTAVHRRFVSDLLDIFGGSAATLVSHLVETGKLTLEDMREVERTLERMERKS
ncbi:MAG: BlaI/MecI/CopY family transcriptional regulator [Bryobacteraceae bacterium]